MKKYTFNIKNNPSTFYTPKYESTDYSKVLNDLIDADVIEKNQWLFGNSIYTTSNPKIKITLKNNDSCNSLEEAFIFGGKKKYSFCDACKFLAGLNINCPFEKNKTYKLSNGDYIEITDDYIHINDQMFFFNLMDNNFFYNLSNSMKKTIATIYVDGLKITIKK